jgi:hypothetical protein
MVTFNFPEDFAFDNIDGLIALSSVELGEPASLEVQIATLPFSVEAVAPYAFESTVGGSIVTLVSGKSGPDMTGLRPLIVVEYTAIPIHDDLTPSTAEQVLRGSNPIFGEIEIDLRERSDFAGHPGWMISGTILNDGTGGGTIRVSQWLSVLDRGLVRMLVRVPVEDHKDLSPAIDEIAASVTAPKEISR